MPERVKFKESCRRAMRVLPRLLAVCAGIAVFWMSGLPGRALRRDLLPRLLPIPVNRIGLEIVQIAELPVAPMPLRGLQVTLSAAHLARVLRDSPLPAWLVPPGLLADGMAVVARWRPPATVSGQAMPVVIALDAAAGSVPRVVFRLTAAELNELLSEEFAEDWSETGEYILGHYDLNQRIWFHTLSVRSEGVPRAGPLDPLRYGVSATGRLRYWFEDGALTARVTANVRSLRGVFGFTPVPHDDGIGFGYAARVESLVISVDRMAPWVERRLAETIRRSIERSLNKRRKRERMAARRLPLWLPLDADIDLVVSGAP